ncbi:carbohydrate ABC transporter permease [Ktedonospora formicarum]|uniref:Sugar ABC transporter permease n=1 Tax=Ktedonospora formicarum TaxID=2778364 RepID=A0A8J3HT10_9CHLR|nr:sugar ABC transporter permease [Ktedonospora formicarum]GHO42726.1 sugar ABC transporter permease [Ktedonospora formicarum]
MSEVMLEQKSALHSRQAQQARTRARWRNELTGFAFVLPFLLAYAIFLIWPVILGFRMSFFNWSLAGTGTDTFLGLSNYVEALGDSNLWGALGNTLLFTIISTPILVILSLVLALLANMAIPARWLFRLAFFAPYVLPVSVVILIWNWLYQPGYGLINSMLTTFGLKEVGWLTDPNAAMMSVVIVTIWWTVGFNFLLYLAGLQQIPQETYEAASIDGANAWSKFISMTIPLLRNTTVTVVILQVISSLQLFAQPFLLTGGGPNFVTRPVLQYVYETAFTSFRIGFASAMSYLFFLVVLIVTIVQFIILYRGEAKGNE